VHPTWKRLALGVLVGLGITTAMDDSGLSIFSSLPLLPLVALFWYFAVSFSVT
jgi:hypothetical protein